MNKKGFTLVELIITIGITSILFLFTGSYFITNTGLFNKEEVRIEVLNSVQIGMDSVLRQLYPVKGIYNVSGSNPLITAGKFVSVELTDSKDSVFTISYDQANKQILKTSGSSTIVLAENVSEFKVDPLSRELPAVSPSPTVNPIASTYTDCIGFRITLTSRIKDSQETLINDVYFRNKE